MKQAKKSITKILILLFIFFILLLFFMAIIKIKLDSQIPSFEQLMAQGINQNFELKIFGITLQRVCFAINSNKEVNITTYNELALYLFPVIFSLISTIVIGIIINKVKKYIEKWKV